MPKPKTTVLPDKHFWIRTEWEQDCHECGNKVYVGDRAVWDAKYKRLFCEQCGKELEE